MKHTRFIMAFAASMLLCANSLLAYDFYVVSNGDTIYYNITSNSSPYTVEVTYLTTGYNSYSGSVTIPSSVTYNGRTYSVTNIGNSAFKNCTGLTSTTIPNSVTSIGSSAFYGCSGLTSVTIPNSVTSIGWSAFYGCTGLTSVTIGNSVTNIGISAFGNCSGLTRTNFTGTISQWCNIDFYHDLANPVYYSRNLYINNQPVTNLVIPNTVNIIKQCAFYRDTCITSVTISNSVTSIGNYAFYGCTSLTSVTIPNSVTSIGVGAFEGCTGLTSVTIPNSVSTIASNAFYLMPNINYNGNATGSPWGALCVNGYFADSLYYTDSTKTIVCSAHKQIHNGIISNSVRKIGEYSFNNCKRLTTLTIGTSVDTISNFAFSYDSSLTTVYFNADSCKSMESYDGYYDYYASVFVGCPNFRTLTIGNNVRNIPDLAFAYCTGLTAVTIPNSVTSIGWEAFADCTGLTSITIGNSVISIGNYAFYDCSSLARINYTGTIAQWCNINFDYFIETGSLNRRLYTGNPLQQGHNLYINNQLVTNLVIPNTVDTIKQCAFIGCTSITSVTIPNSVTSIGNYAFYSCSGLTSITFRRANTTIGTDAFYGVTTSIPIYIPCNSLGWYVNKMPNFNNFIEVLQYSYSATSQDTVKGTVTTVTAPTCNTPSWTISATANTGYNFSRWSDGNTQNPRILTVTQDTALVAYFTGGSSPQWYRFSVVSEDTLKGTVQIITQPSQSNPQATFVALPNTGYTFSRWSDGNTQNPRTLTVTQDTVLVACFTSSSQQWYNFNVVSEDVNKGTVQVLAQPSQSNPQATFVALPNTGYTFSRWSDGNTQNPRSITVTQDTILIAFFTSNQGIAEAENASITIYPNPASDKVTLEGIGNEADIFIINAMGKVVRRLENAGATITFSVGDLPKGIYFVRVGNAVRKLVID